MTNYTTGHNASRMPICRLTTRCRTCAGDISLQQGGDGDGRSLFFLHRARSRLFVGLDRNWLGFYVIVHRLIWWFRSLPICMFQCEKCLNQSM